MIFYLHKYIMSLVDFVHRGSKPSNPNKGTFYWVEENDKTEIWFASTNDEEGLILLNNKLDDGIISRISDAEGNIDNIRNILNEIDLSPYLTNDDLTGYVKTEDIENFITSDDLDYLASKSDLDGYVKKDDVVDYLTSSDLDGYVKVEDIPDVSEFVTKEDIQDIISDSDYDIILEKVNERLTWKII